MKRVRKVVDAVLRWFGYSRSAPMWDAFKRMYPMMKPDVPVFRRENGAEVLPTELLLAYDYDRALWAEWLHSIEDQILLSIQGQYKSAISINRLLEALDAPVAGAVAAWLDHPATRDVMIASRAAQRVAALKKEAADAKDALKKVQREKDAAYLERNRLVATLARIFPSGVRKTAIPGWDPEWHGCVFIDLPTGQASWHYHDSHAFLFEGLPPYETPWDGHTTEEKYRRLEQLSALPAIALIDPSTFLAAHCVFDAQGNESGIALRIRPETRVMQLAHTWRVLADYLLAQPGISESARALLTESARQFDTATAHASRASVVLGRNSKIGKA